MGIDGRSRRAVWNCHEGAALRVIFVHSLFLHRAALVWLLVAVLRLVRHAHVVPLVDRATSYPTPVRLVCWRTRQCKSG